MQAVIDHYARMKFAMNSKVLYNGQTATITGWSTNGDAGEATTYCYQLNSGGDLVQETELLSLTPEGASATETPATETPVTETPATETPATETPATGILVTELLAPETPAPQ